jgi:signal transduction histidine kinase
MRPGPAAAGEPDAGGALARCRRWCDNPDMSDTPAQKLHRQTPLLFVLYFVAYMSVLVRMFFSAPPDDPVRPAAWGLMAGFLALSVIQPPVGRRWPVATHVLLALQCLVVIALLLTRPRFDFYGMLFIGLSIMAGTDLPPRASVVWIAVLCVVSVLALVASYGGQAAQYAPVYIAGCLIIGLYGRATRNAEAARARSEELRTELESANRRLHAYAERAEEAAAEQERAHLARDLHDAATQTVFSMNLTAETARIALKESPDKVEGLIDRLQELARDALAEMRTLVRELRPSSVVDEGLVKSLERLAALRERRDGIRVTLVVRGEEEGGVEVKETIFRTAREALNNIAKHAGVKESRLDLSFGSEDIALLVQDAGRGFDPAAARRTGSYGLLAMRERVEALDGTLQVRSAPGAGTEIEARFPLAAREAARAIRETARADGQTADRGEDS